MTTTRLSSEPRSRIGAPTYVYGVAEGAPQVRTGGVAGSEVHVLEHDGLAAIVSPVSSARLKAKRRDLLAHQEVLQEAFAETTVVPLRFGTIFDDGDAVIDELLVPRRDALLGLLRSLDGVVELSVRAYYVEQAALHELLRENKRLAALRGRTTDMALGEAVASALDAKRAAEAAEIERALVRLAEDAVIESARTAYEIFRGEFLVRRGRIGAFDDVMNKLAQQREGTVVFKYLGPLPPHSFVDLAGGG